jgi:hypothetical protein
MQENPRGAGSSLFFQETGNQLKRKKERKKERKEEE